MRITKGEIRNSQQRSLEIIIFMKNTAKNVTAPISLFRKKQEKSTLVL
jgi:hypothetical protein